MNASEYLFTGLTWTLFALVNAVTCGPRRSLHSGWFFSRYEVKSLNTQHKVAPLPVIVVWIVLGFYDCFLKCFWLHLWWFFTIRMGWKGRKKACTRARRREEEKGEYGVSVSPYQPTENVDPFFLLWSINCTGKSLDQDHLPCPARDEKN